MRFQTQGPGVRFFSWVWGRSSIQLKGKKNGARVQRPGFLCRLCLSVSLGNPWNLWTSVSLSIEWAVILSPAQRVGWYKRAKQEPKFPHPHGDMGKKAGLHFCFSGFGFQLGALGSGLCSQTLGAHLPGAWCLISASHPTVLGKLNHLY